MCKSVINAINFAGGGGSVATGVLQIAGGVALDGTLRAVEDQNGTDSLLKLSTAAVNIGSGTITNNGILTIKGSGANILSLRNNSNVEITGVDNSGNFNIGGYSTPTAKITIKGGGGGQRIQEWVNSLDNVYQYVTDGGVFFSTYYQTGSSGYYRFLNRGLIEAAADGVFTLKNDNGDNFGRLNFGGTTNSFPALQRSSGAISVIYADGTTGFAGFAAGEGTKKGISVIKGGTNTPFLGFYGADEIAQPTTAIAEATFASGGAGTNIKTDDTFGGYTLQQIAQALLDLGFLS